MNIGANAYQELAMRTANPEHITLSNVGLGIAGEAGEVADLIKKHLHHNHELDREELIKELGDVCWYVALGCTALNIDMGEVMQRNIEKLKKRYPDGFDSNKSINREE